MERETIKARHNTEKIVIGIVGNKSSLGMIRKNPKQHFMNRLDFWIHNIGVQIGLHLKNLLDGESSLFELPSSLMKLSASE